MAEDNIVEKIEDFTEGEIQEIEVDFNPQPTEIPADMPPVPEVSQS